MTTRLALPTKGGLVAAVALLTAGIGTGAATACTQPGNGPHAGQGHSSSPSASKASTHTASAYTAHGHGSPSRSASQPAQHPATAQPAAATHATGPTHASKPARHSGATPSSVPASSAAPAAATHPAHSTHSSHPSRPAHSAPAGHPGNNGTVKIAGVGDIDSIPNNTPHPGCSFEVQWYGFDGGPDVVSTVSFTAQAPTSDAGITVHGPTRVPVGGDGASGAGTATGLDAVATYHLDFTGAPAKQGYHVRLVVETPRSNGNDTKSKVFWIAPCGPAATATPSSAASAAASAAPVTGVSDSSGPVAAPAATTAPTTAPTPAPATASAAGAAASDDATPQTGAAAVYAASTVGGAQPEADTSTASRQAAGIPTAIDAGERHSALTRFVRSAWGASLIAAGILVILIGLVVGARRRA